MKQVKSVLRFHKLSENATAPVKGSKYAAGFDLFSAYEYSIPAKGRNIVKTDIQIQVPEDCYGRVAPRSGLALKGIDVGAGVVDKDYRGNLGIILYNFSDCEFIVRKGDRVAQLICEKIEYPEIEECESLDDSERGGAGFGSTGGFNPTSGDTAGNGVSTKSADSIIEPKGGSPSTKSVSSNK